MRNNYISFNPQVIYPNVAGSDCFEKKEDVSTPSVTSQIQINKVNVENLDLTIDELISSLMPKNGSDGNFNKFRVFCLTQCTAPLIFDVVNKKIE